MKKVNRYCTSGGVFIGTEDEFLESDMKHYHVYNVIPLDVVFKPIHSKIIRIETQGVNYDYKYGFGTCYPR